jgi:prepilin-type N-terminal cleavage/methylation domain-containing protein
VKALRARSGFTLAEVAVTIVIVGIALVLVLQGLNTSKITAAHTRNQKLARELGMFTLGQIESGLLRDDIETGMSGNYAEEGYPDFNWEIAVGDDALRQPTQDGKFDSWAPTAAEEEAKKDEEEDAEEPFEKVRIRVMYPKIREFTNELTLERWIPWKQVYGEAEGENASKNAKASKGADAGAGSAPSNSGAKGATKP